MAENTGKIKATVQFGIDDSSYSKVVKKANELGKYFKDIGDSLNGLDLSKFQKTLDRETDKAYDSIMSLHSAGHMVQEKLERIAKNLDISSILGSQIGSLDTKITNLTNGSLNNLMKKVSQVNDAFNHAGGGMTPIFDSINTNLTDITSMLDKVNLKGITEVDSSNLKGVVSSLERLSTIINSLGNTSSLNDVTLELTDIEKGNKTLFNSLVDIDEQLDAISRGDIEFIKDRELSKIEEAQSDLDALEEMIENFTDHGIGLDKIEFVDPVSKGFRDLKSIEDYEKAFEDLDYSVLSLQERIDNGLENSLDDLQKELLGYREALLNSSQATDILNKKMGNKSQTSGLTDIVKAIERLNKVKDSDISKIVDHVRTLSKELSKIDVDFKGLGEYIKESNKYLKETYRHAERTEKEMTKVAKSTDKVAKSTEKTTKLMTQLRNAAASVGVYLSASSIKGYAEKLGTSTLHHVRAMNTLKTVFGDLNTEAEDYIDKMSKLYLLNPTDMAMSMSRYGSIIKTAGIEVQTALEMSKNLTLLSYDLGAVFNRPGYTQSDVMDAIMSGLVGETEAIQNYGIQMEIGNMQSFFKDEYGIEKIDISSLGTAEQYMARYIVMMGRGEQYANAHVKSLSNAYGKWEAIKNITNEVISSLGSLFLGIIDSAFERIMGVLLFTKAVIEELASRMGIEIVPNIDIADSLGDIPDATEDTEDLNKELEKTKGILAGFDDVTVLNQQTDTNLTKSEELSATEQRIRDIFAQLEGVSWEDYVLGIDVDMEKVKAVADKIEWIKDNFGTILNIAKNVGIAMLGWKLSTALLGQLAAMKTFADTFLAGGKNDKDKKDGKDGKDGNRTGVAPVVPIGGDGEKKEDKKGKETSGKKSTSGDLLDLDFPSIIPVTGFGKKNKDGKGSKDSKGAPVWGSDPDFEIPTFVLQQQAEDKKKRDSELNKKVKAELEGIEQASKRATASMGHYTTGVNVLTEAEKKGIKTKKSFKGGIVQVGGAFKTAGELAKKAKPLLKGTGITIGLSLLVEFGERLHGAYKESDNFALGVDTAFSKVGEKLNFAKENIKAMAGVFNGQMADDFRDMARELEEIGVTGASSLRLVVDSTSVLINPFNKFTDTVINSIERAGSYLGPAVGQVKELDTVVGELDKKGMKNLLFDFMELEAASRGMSLQEYMQSVDGLEKSFGKILKNISRESKLTEGDLRAMAEALGLSYDKLQAGVSPETVAKISEVKEAFDEVDDILVQVGISADSTGKRIMSDEQKARIESAIDSILEYTDTHISEINARLEESFEGLSQGYEIAFGSEAEAKVQQATEAFNEYFSGLRDKMEKNNEEMKEINKNFNDMTVEEQARALERKQELQAENNEIVNKLYSQSLEELSRLNLLYNENEKAVTAEKISEVIKMSIEEREEKKRLAQETYEEQAGLAQFILDTNKDLSEDEKKKWQGIIDNAREARDAQTEAADEAHKAIVKSAEEYFGKELVGVVDESTGEIKTKMESVAEEGIKPWRLVLEEVLQLVKDIIRELPFISSAMPLLDKFTDKLFGESSVPETSRKSTGLIPQVNRTPAQQSALDAIRSNKANSVYDYQSVLKRGDAVPHRNGGIIRRPTFALIGESGPERILSPKETILFETLSNVLLGAKGSTPQRNEGIIENHFHVSGIASSDERYVRDLARQLKPYLT